MATKTFKIGLSNTDKQNMAQDVYERLLALTFQEYDSAESYDVGDFVVYNDQLYKCIGATTGAWDSTKWQLATLNDLVTDIEDAVQFVNDKANVDGNYPTMTVGAADNLTPYSEDSGDDQDVPFIFQGTGCGNGETQVDTGALALLKEKQGHSVVVNQWAKDDGTTTTVAGVTITNLGNGKYRFNGTATEDITYWVTNEINHSNGDYDLFGFANLGSSIVGVTLVDGYGGFSTGTINSHLVSNQYNLSAYYIKIANGTQLNDVDLVPIVIKLGQWFGSNDNIPSHLLSHPEYFFRYYQGSLAYNEGTLVNANGRYLKTFGRNQWDEEWEVGGINVSTGQDVSFSGIRSKGYNKCNPNTTYFFYVRGIPVVRIMYFYDKDKNYISSQEITNVNATITSPSNAIYFRFGVGSYYGTTYNHDITISIYYSGESGYDQYYPYEVLTNNDTGTETLRSAGSVKDSKAPDGTITRRVGSVDLSTLSWAKDSDGKFYATLSGTINGLSTLSCNKYLLGTYSQWSNETADKIIFIVSPSNLVYVRDTDLTGTQTPTGTLFYELATPTTEQGTLFSENLVIDDFGSMSFEGTSGVPQGNLIFYPVDYKAFLDTFYNQVGGDGNNVLPKVGDDESLSADSPETLKQLLDYIDGLHAIEQANAGGTLRQCLCLKESLDFEDTDYLDLGSLTYSYYPNGSTESVDCYISSSADALLKNNAKAISSKFITSSTSTDPIIPNSFAIGSGSSKLYIWVTKNAYTDATAFKNAVKGDLLAYEKASE